MPHGPAHPLSFFAAVRPAKFNPHEAALNSAFMSTHTSAVI